MALAKQQAESHRELWKVVMMFQLTKLSAGIQNQLQIVVLQ